MKLFTSALRIGIAVAIINCAARTALVYWSFYQFQDSAQQLAILGFRSSPDALRSTAFDRATNLFIPITEDQIMVTRDGLKTLIAASWEQPLEYFPNRTYPLKMSFTVEGVNLASDDVKR